MQAETVVFQTATKPARQTLNVQFCVERCVKADLFLSLKPFSEIFYCVSVRGFIHLKSTASRCD